MSVYLKKYYKLIDFLMPIDREDFTLLYWFYCKKLSFASKRRRNLQKFSFRKWDAFRGLKLVIGIRNVTLYV